MFGGGLYEDLMPLKPEEKKQEPPQKPQISSEKTVGENESTSNQTNQPVQTSEEELHKFEAKFFSQALKRKSIQQTPTSKKKQTKTNKSSQNENSEPKLDSSGIDAGQTLVTSTAGEDYDPIKPNDYEEYLEEKKQKRKESKKRDRSPSRERSPSRSKKRSSRGAQIAPPSFYHDDLDSEKGSGSSKKESEKKEEPPKRTQQPKKKEAKSRILLLTNIVSRGQVDSELQGEIEDECAKFGRVKDCKIYQDSRTNLPESEAVRIFVEFANEDGANKAREALNGRLFAGKHVQATCFEEDKWKKKQFQYDG